MICCRTLGVSLYLISYSESLTITTLCCIVPLCLYPFFLYDVDSKNDLEKWVVALFGFVNFNEI